MIANFAKDFLNQQDR